MEGWAMETAREGERDRKRDGDIKRHRGRGRDERAKPGHIILSFFKFRLKGGQWRQRGRVRGIEKEI